MSRLCRGWRSGKEKVAEAERLLDELQNKVPGIIVHNRSVTTSSIYCKTPDGYSLRIGDHAGKDQYKYKWNLNPRLPRTAQGWKKDFLKGRGKVVYVWRFYTSDVDTLAKQLKKSKNNTIAEYTQIGDLWDRPLREYSDGD